MRKAILGVVLGAVVYFVAGALSWMVLPWSNHGLKKLPEETLIRDTMKVVLKEPGAYMFPSDKTDNGKMDDKSYLELFKNGPSGIMFVRLGGTEPMSASNLVISGFTALVTSAFAMVFLILLRKRVTTLMGRWLVVVFLGAFAWFNSLMPFWNWMAMPSTYLGTIFLDVLFGFGLLGIVLAKFVPVETPR